MSRRHPRPLEPDEREFLGRIREYLGMRNELAWYFWTEGITVEERDGVLVGTGGNVPRYVEPWDPKKSEITIQKALYRLPKSVYATAEELDH